MRDIVSCHQFGFIASKQIHVAIAIASEVINCLPRRAYGGNMALKVDIHKVFDTIRWNFILEVLCAFEFLDR